MHVLSLVLSPVIWVMNLVFEAYVDVIGSVGLAILLLSLTFSLLLSPLQKKGAHVEKRVTDKMKAVHEEVQAARRKGLRGEALFNETESIYTQHHYHPIHAVMAVAGFLTTLPVLISSIILFRNSPDLVGEPFLFITDLSKPDHVLGWINILPPIMFAITLVDAMLRYPGNRGAQRRFLLVAVVLFGLVYAMPAGLVLYWIGNNLTSFALARMIEMRAFPR